MEHRFDTHDWTGFLDLAARYRVRCVAHHGVITLGDERVPFLTLVWHENDWAIYQLGPSVR
jgi:hypothetical protein